MRRLVVFDGSTKRLVDPIGYNDLICASSMAGSGTAAPSPVTVNGHRVDSWAIGDSKTFIYHPNHDYVENTIITSHVHWGAISSNPNTAHMVQFDVTSSIARSFARSQFSTNRTISLLDSPTGYNRNEIIEATNNQALIVADGLEIDAIINITVQRVTPASGTSYTGNVAVYFADLHYFSDGRNTNEKTYPFTKSW